MPKFPRWLAALLFVGLLPWPSDASGQRNRSRLSTAVDSCWPPLAPPWLLRTSEPIAHVLACAGATVLLVPATVPLSLGLLPHALWWQLRARTLAICMARRRFTLRPRFKVAAMVVAFPMELIQASQRFTANRLRSLWARQLAHRSGLLVAKRLSLDFRRGRIFEKRIPETCVSRAEVWPFAIPADRFVLDASRLQ